ncbi:hypothetical protein GCM10011415_37810 [Salipiger pallidus]|uniref:Uncharacterized protein n=1 Tax=Salipiger pallidus TaxID=1775170 RepID=A0A8J3EI85_9RHOB|nr:hypothetical protein [Salipiger pallidus]GGG84168.1 hypothetical protein GCM10011415_37810 [Salipiger pallidus]
MTLPEAPTVQPLHKAAQRLRWFVRAFEEQADKTEAETGNRFAIDHAALAKVFAEWLRAFEAQKPIHADDKQAYVGFAAGLMLRTLLALKPATLEARPENADQSNPAYFWPEGYLYVAFCLNVRGLVLENDFHHEQHVSPAMAEARTWWSFRENVEQDPSLAIAFLDLFAGDEPEWSMPELFRSGKMREIASRFYAAPAIGEDD